MGWCSRTPLTPSTVCTYAVDDDIAGGRATNVFAAVRLCTFQHLFDDHVVVVVGVLQVGHGIDSLQPHAHDLVVQSGFHRVSQSLPNVVLDRDIHRQNFGNQLAASDTNVLVFCTTVAG